MALTNIGYDVVEHAASAEETVKTTVELEPDLILMRAIILESKNWIKSMALIHSQLYESENLSEINMKRFVDKILLRSLHSYPV
jgi:DNA-binding NarL/FixJ family response regulator